MNGSKFTKGDRVKVIRQGIKTTGQKGTVEFAYGPSWDDSVEVRLDGGYYATYKQEALEKVTAAPKSTSSAKDTNETVVYFVYLHDNKENPKTLEEAKNKFCLDEPYAVVFDVNEAVEAAKEGFDSDNGFILANNKIYPISKSVSVPGLTAN